MRKKRRGLGLPSILYVKNFIVKGEQNTDSVPTSRSTENGIQEVGNLDSNNIDINNTDMSYTYDQSINPPRTDFQNFSPGAVENDRLIDGIV